MRSSVFSCLVPLKPALDLRFAIDKYLDPRITFTRASIGTYWDANGVLQTAASGAARFDHDPITGESKGLLIEEARTNLLPHSTAFDNVAWAKVGGATVSANAIMAPDGTLTADKFIEGAGATTPLLSFSTPVSAGVTYAFSIYAKAGERSAIQINYAGYVLGNFFLATGVAIASPNNAGFTSLSARLELCANGWYRCILVATAIAAIAGAVRYYLNPSVLSVPAYNGDGASGLYLWGAQLEVGAFATSYIPTTTAAVTRAADVAVMNGTNFSSWYNQSEGTFVVAARSFAATVASNKRQIYATDGTANERIGIHFATGISSYIISDGGVAQAGPSMGAASDNVLYKHTLAYKLNDVGASVNGGAVASDTSATMPAPDRMEIGSGLTVDHLNGHIARITYYNTRLSDPVLRRLSA
jgi:hypothetical protein